MQMKLFLTGATSSVGASAMANLLARGCSVTALVTKPVQIDGCRTVVASLESLDGATGTIGECDAIVHLACTGSSERSAVLRQDIAGMASLIGAWRKGPFIYVSASTVYGYPLGVVPERNMIDLWYGYDVGKFANELQLRLAERQGGRGGAVLLRPAMILAVNQRRSDRQMLRSIYAQCRQGARFIFDSDEGLANYGCAFVGGNDFGVAITEVLTRDLSGPFNLAGGFVTWHNLIQTINKIAGTRGDFVIRADTRPQPGEFRLPQSRTELDTTAFQQATGFQPRETLEEIVEAFVRMERTQRPV